MIGNAVLHYLKYVAGLEQPHTQTTPAEQATIRRFAAGARTAVEIGVYEGVNTAIIANALQQPGTLYAIDPFFKGRLGICYHERIARRHVGKSPRKNDVVWLAMLSFDAPEHVAGPIDFLFVDGDHSYEGIEKDWRLWAPRVAAGGLVLLHDTSVPPHDPGVGRLGSFRYFQEVIRHDPRFEHVAEVDSLNILRKKP